MRVALILPPLTQLNTPYPSTGYLARFLRTQGVGHTQHDLGLALALRVLSRDGIREIFDHIEAHTDNDASMANELPEPAWRALALREAHEAGVEAAVAILQGPSRTLASRVLCGLLPTTPRLEGLDIDAFGSMGTVDAARFLATRYLADLADLIAHTVDPDFGLARYGHHLAVGPVRFDPLAERLARTTVIDAHLDALVDEILATGPDAVGLSVPFPGTLISALRIGRRCRDAGVPVIMGGGYVNTELREVNEPRLWDHVDALSYDAGEGPLLAWLTHLDGGPDRRHRTRTVAGLHDASEPAPPMTSAAWYGELPLDRYLQLVDSLNPTHRLWSDGRWNKITLAHGCYWKRCAFCDVTLDYIARFEPARVESLVDAMVELREQTGESGFHFVDEAAPPRVMRDLALRLLARGETASWWGNVRFEEAFTPDLCRLLAAAGLVAVTGGLEVASDRLLQLMDKGVTIEQAARAAHALQAAGIGVHAYLMYGFPTQTAQETADALEVVRQLFAEGLLDSAFWHRFVLTRHSGVYADPARFQVTIDPVPPNVFATNDLPHHDPRGADHDRFDEGLVASLGAWMQGRGLDEPLATWFEQPIPHPTTPSSRVRQALPRRPPPMKPRDRLVWLGGTPMDGEDARGPVLVLHHGGGTTRVPGTEAERDWLAEVLDSARPDGEPLHFAEARDVFPGDWGRFQKRWQRVRRAGLVGV